MSHKHIAMDDVRRFATLATRREADLPDWNPEWMSDFGAKVRYCPECSRRARQGGVATLPMDWIHLDPTTDTDECLDIDEIADLELLREEGTALGEHGREQYAHLQACARCQLVYLEALALGEIGLPEEEAGRVDGGLVLRLVSTTLKVAAGWGGVVLAHGLASGLLGTADEEEKAVGEAVMTDGEPKGTRIRVKNWDKQLLVSDLPPSIDPATLRLRVDGGDPRSPSATGEREATFDLADYWQDAEHSLELFLASNQ